MIFPASFNLLLCWVRWCLTLMGLAVALAIPGAAWAQSCYNGSYQISFGTVSANSNTDVTALLPYQCQSNASVTYYKVCLFVPGGTGAIAGIDPKKMQDYSGNFINYNLYSDAARTRVIGPPPTGAGYTPYTWDFSVPGGYGSPPRTLNVYGRVPPVPSGTAAGNYQGQPGNTVLKFAWSNTATPADCFTADGGVGEASYFTGVTATVSNTCSIAISQAGDLNFGSADSLTLAVDGSSTITVSCPSNTSWKLGLNDGQHAVVAGQRRMAGPSPDFIRYELYRDPSRTQRWGNDTAGGTNTASGSGASQTNPTALTVYGRVPVQPVGAPGDYVDTVTVTLTY